MTAGRTCRVRAAEMFRLAFATGEADAPDAVVLTLTADLWRRAGHFDEATESAAEAERLLAACGEDDDSRSGTAAIATLVRALAESGDDAGLRAKRALALREFALGP